MQRVVVYKYVLKPGKKVLYCHFEKLLIYVTCILVCDFIVPTDVKYEHDVACNYAYVR
jgi:hypothetical protein